MPLLSACEGWFCTHFKVQPYHCQVPLIYLGLSKQLWNNACMFTHPENSIILSFWRLTYLYSCSALCMMLSLLPILRKHIYSLPSLTGTYVLTSLLWGWNSHLLAASMLVSFLSSFLLLMVSINVSKSSGTFYKTLFCKPFGSGADTAITFLTIFKSSYHYSSFASVGISR